MVPGRAGSPAGITVWPRDLAVAARSPASRWEITIVDERGYAVGHGVARPLRGTRGASPQPPRPGWHGWKTPTGRTYVQEPWRYIA